MSFDSQGFDGIEVMNVDVNKDSEEATQYLLGDRNEGLREWNVCHNQIQLER